MITTVADARVPVPAPERIHALDILRGFALFAMIVVHFHQNVNLEAAGLEGLIGWIVWIGLENKSWGTFAFLFGVGFEVLLRRFEAKGMPIAAIYLRRLLVLALFGVVAEAVFGFRVLLGYAIWGVPLLFLHRLPARVLIAIAAVAVMAIPIAFTGPKLGLWPSPITPERLAVGRPLEAAIELASRGDSFTALVSARFDMLVFEYLRPLKYIPSVDLALFILGLLALRAGIFDDPRRHTRLILGWMTFGVVSWALFWLVINRLPPPEHSTVLVALRPLLAALVRDQWLCFTYIGGIVLLLAYRDVWRQRLAWLGWAGRMALTNYMLQVAALDFVVSGYGLGLKLRPAYGMIGAALLFGAEAALGHWWLARYRFGPCEWVWRSLTYLKRQPMRRPAAAEPQPAGV